MQIVQVRVLCSLAALDVLRCACDCGTLVVLDCHELVEDTSLHSGRDLCEGELVLLNPVVVGLGLFKVAVHCLREALAALVEAWDCGSESYLGAIQVVDAVVVGVFALMVGSERILLVEHCVWPPYKGCTVNIHLD